MDWEPVAGPRGCTEARLNRPGAQVATPLPAPLERGLGVPERWGTGRQTSNLNNGRYASGLSAAEYAGWTPGGRSACGLPLHR